MFEILTRLGFALVLSIGLALMFAWGWDHSDSPSAQGAPMASSTLVEGGTAADAVH